MSKNFKVLGIVVLLIGLAVAGWFLVTGQSQKIAEKTQDNNVESQDIKQSIESGKQKRVEEQKKEKDLVWYEIPEMNIKFLVEKEMVGIIGYSDFYTEDDKVNGKRLYIKDFYIKGDNKVPVAFAELIIDRTVKDIDTGEYHFLSEYCLGNKNIKILAIKKGAYRVCYLNKSLSFSDDIEIFLDSWDNGLRDVAKKLLQGYLKEVPVTLINK